MLRRLAQGHGQPLELDASDDCVEHQQATLFVAESSTHLMVSLLHLLNQSFDGIGGSDGLPVLRRERVEL